MRAGEAMPEPTNLATASTNEAARSNGDSVQHTPGPWRIETDLVRVGDIEVVSGRLPNDWQSVAFVDVRKHGEDDDEAPCREVALANARLIAAAPEMLVALKALMDDDETVMLSEMWEQARAAIANAEGR